MTHGLFVVLGHVLEVERGLDADEARLAGALVATQGFDGRADGAGFTGVRVHEHLRARYALLDVVDLGLDGRQVVLRAALQHELGAERSQPRNLYHVLPDVLGQHLREPCQ